MSSYARATIVLLLFASSSVIVSAQVVVSSTPTSITSLPPEGPLPVWSHTLPAPSVQLPAITAAALAPNGHCVAVAGVGAVDVLDTKGKTLWTWEYGKVNKFIVAGALAVSPRCDAIALVGSSSYKYTWVVSRQGFRVPIQTTSTPLGIAFSHDGESIALGTGACDLLLLGKSGSLKWKKVFKEGFCIFDELSFSADDKFILAQAGLVALDGTLLWSTNAWMAPASNLQTFVSWWVPNHGHATGRVSALAADGKVLWSRVAPGESAAISASGDIIAAPVYQKQQLTPEEWDNVEDIPVEIQVISRSGELLNTLPVGGTQVLAMSPDGNRVLVRVPEFVEELNLNGDVLLKISDPQMSYSKVFVADDFSAALIWRRSMGNAVEWFTLK
jgi:hypothetical protein